MLKKISTYVGILLIGVAVGQYFNGFHTIEEKIVYKDRVKTQIREVIKEAPDGTKVTERFIDKEQKSDKKVAKKETKPAKKDWGIGIKADLLPNPVGGNVVYTVEVHRRVIWDAYVSAYGRTDGVGGVGITLFF
jgi:hypothetical protein